MVTVSSPRTITAALITGCLCIGRRWPGGMVIFNTVISGWPEG